VLTLTGLGLPVVHFTTNDYWMVLSEPSPEFPFLGGVGEETG
jgi:hypothetical protein